ncbi:MAG: VWA domain-containing protein [Okeania sp. SIO3I5]|uniref:vWA domain-containing protein n=1 Tax=Okeania sp. SIO3I5 TaxID=2607805 RepID=UPI0013B6AD59|nr:vWA domain-containing protein [Okeania sp. SIO3I5]NEQ41600.1 VWA domain-containing protein [Okeania sp. SIO3I5]
MYQKIAALKKILIFGILAAFGCLIGAIIGELLLPFIVPTPTLQQIDVLFVLDATESMGEEINGVKNGISNFVTTLNSRELDSQVGLIAFRDRFHGAEPEILSFEGKPFTKDIDSFRTELGKIGMISGVDWPESSLDALVLGARQPFREDATKVILLITDASPKIPDKETPSVAAAEKLVRDQGIDQLHLVISNKYRSIFQPLQREVDGEIFSLARTAAARQNFDKILPEIGEKIASAIGTGEIPIDQKNSLIIATSLWTALLAIFTFILLTTGQKWYLGTSLNFFQGTAGVAGSLAAGLVAGGIGEFFYGGMADISLLSITGRSIAWGILGALLAFGMAFFIPNLQGKRALVGGAVGGVLGAIAFLFIATTFGDLAGRLIGAAILGFCIGIMIVITEVLFRKAWLEISYGPKEIKTVNLGKEIVTVGSNPELCIVYVPETPSVALKFQLAQGNIFCENVETGNKQSVQPGYQIDVGRAKVTVCGAQATTSTLPSSTTMPPLSSRSSFSLNINGRVINLNHNTQLKERDISGLTSQSNNGIVAKVNLNPKDPNILGLQNLSNQTWVAIMANGESKNIEPTRTLKLAVGTQIKFGSVKGQINS